MKSLSCKFNALRTLNSLYETFRTFVHYHPFFWEAYMSRGVLLVMMGVSDGGPGKLNRQPALWPCPRCEQAHPLPLCVLPV